MSVRIPITPSHIYTVSIHTNQKRAPTVSRSLKPRSSLCRSTRKSVVRGLGAHGISDSSSSGLNPNNLAINKITLIVFCLKFAIWHPPCVCFCVLGRTANYLVFFFKDFIYSFLERREGREKENINGWLPLECPLLKTWPAPQACALTGNQTADL